MVGFLGMRAFWRKEEGSFSFVRLAQGEGRTGCSSLPPRLFLCLFRFLLSPIATILIDLVLQTWIVTLLFLFDKPDLVTAALRLSASPATARSLLRWGREAARFRRAVCLSPRVWALQKCQTENILFSINFI